MQFACLTMRTIAGPSGTRDALAHNWFPFVAGFDLKPAPLPNNANAALSLFTALSPALLILTGGNDLCAQPGEDKLSDGSDNDPTRDLTEKMLLNAALETGTPVLGVCRGMQMLNMFFGGKVNRDLSRAGHPGHVAKPHDILFKQSGWAPLLPTEPLATNSYHAQGITRKVLSPELTPIAHDSNGLIEAVIHETLPVLGVQWHPERPGSCSDQDRQLVQELLLQRR